MSAKRCLDVVALSYAPVPAELSWLLSSAGDGVEFGLGLGLTLTLTPTLTLILTLTLTPTPTLTLTLTR